ncbi:MAG: efflux RND transporter periplasmic adaptor subunit [bacterium]|jgi:HlyD family secretion protein
MKMGIPVVLLMIVGVAGYAWYVLHTEENFPYSGTIEAEDTMLGSRVGGRVISVEVQEGDEVKPGDILIRLDREKLEKQLLQAQAERDIAYQKWLELSNGSRIQEITQAEAALEQAKANLRLLQSGPREEEIRSARKNAAAAQEELELARITRDRMEKLHKSGDVTRERYDQALTSYNVSRNRYEAAQAELDRLQTGYRREEIQAAESKVKMLAASLDLIREGPREEQIAQAKAQLDMAEALVQQIQVDLDETIIRSPSMGVVETSRLQPGDLLAANQPAITLILYEPIWVRVYVPESHLGEAQVGKSVQLSVKSYSDKTFRGKIVQLEREAEFTPRNVQTPENRDDLVFGVKIHINDPERLLRPGMTADVSLSPETGAGDE